MHILTSIELHALLAIDSLGHVWTTTLPLVDASLVTFFLFNLYLCTLSWSLKGHLQTSMFNIEHWRHRFGFPSYIDYWSGHAHTVLLHFHITLWISLLALYLTCTGFHCTWKRVALSYLVVIVHNRLRYRRRQPGRECIALMVWGEALFDTCVRCVFVSILQ